MSRKFSKHQVILAVAVVFLAELLHVLWEHFNAGVISHHLLNSSDMASISNWWGLLWLPLLTLISIRFLQKRKSETITITAGFIGSLIYAASFAFCFSSGYEAATSILFPGMLLISILVPIYRAEYLLGFVLGMTFTLGAIIPSIVAGVLGLLSAFVHLILRPLLLRLFRRLRKLRPTSSDAP
jgi:hypothetical protein